MENKGKNKVLFLICLFIVVSFFVVSSFILYYNSNKDLIFLKNESVVQLADYFYEENSDTLTGTIQIYYIAPTWNHSTIMGLIFPGYNVSTISGIDASSVNYGMYDLKSQILELSINKSDFDGEIYLKDAEIAMSDGTVLQVDLGEIVLIQPEPQEILTSEFINSDSMGFFQISDKVSQDCIVNSIDIIPSEKFGELIIYINGIKVNEINGIYLKKGDTIVTEINYDYTEVNNLFTSYSTFVRYDFNIDGQQAICYSALNLYGLNSNIDSGDIYDYLKEVGGL